MLFAPAILSLLVATNAVSADLVSAPPQPSAVRSDYPPKPAAHSDPKITPPEPTVFIIERGHAFKQKRRAEASGSRLIERRQELRVSRGKTNEFWKAEREFPVMFLTPRMRKITE